MFPWEGKVLTRSEKATGNSPQTPKYAGFRKDWFISGGYCRWSRSVLTLGEPGGGFNSSSRAQGVPWRYGQWWQEQGIKRQVPPWALKVWICMAFDPWSVGLQFTAGWGWKDSGVCAICSIRQICSTVPSLCTISLWTWLALETLLTINLPDPLVRAKAGFMVSQIWVALLMECAQNHN